MRPTEVLHHIAPTTWLRLNAGQMFGNSTAKAEADDVQLSASQKYGVVPQSKLMEEEDTKYMLALSGTENFKHVDIDDFVISLRSFEGGFEHSAYSGCVSPAYTVLRQKKAIQASYWKHLFKSSIFREMLAAFNVGVRDGKSIRYDDFARFVLAIPPLDLQSTIAGYLDRETAHIDALISKKIRFIELLREKRQALITHAVTKGLDPNVKMKDSGVEWLGKVPEHWRIARFRDLCTSISTGPFGTALGNEDYVSNGIPVINPSHIIDGKIVSDTDVSVSDTTANRLSFWRLAVGDLVAARRGELGRAAIVTNENDGWLCGTGSLRVRPKSEKSSVHYLYAVLQSRYAREWLNQSSVGATMANLNEEILGNLPVAAPSNVMEQAQIIDRMNIALKRIDNLTDKTERSIELLKERRSALITAAVTGQIDLREAA